MFAALSAEQLLPQTVLSYAGHAHPHIQHGMSLLRVQKGFKGKQKRGGLCALPLPDVTLLTWDTLQTDCLQKTSNQPLANVTSPPR